MKTWRIPAIVLGAIYLGFVAYLALSAGGLPARVATHFDASGQPNGWMSRSSHVVFTLVFGFAVPLFVVGLMYVTRFLPDALVNIPRRDYWLSGERRSETLAYLLRQALWFACMNVVFVAGIHFLVVDANRAPSPQLSTPMVLTLAGTFLAGVVAWVTMLILHFRRTG